MSQGKDAPLASPDNQEEGEEGVAEGANKFYCYLCSITCHNQQVGWTYTYSGKCKDFVKLFSFIFLIFSSPCFFVELQESYEQCFPPAEDDGDPTHEQRMPGHPAATSAWDSTGNKQRRVSVKHTNMHSAFYFNPKQGQSF